MKHFIQLKKKTDST